MSIIANKLSNKKMMISGLLLISLIGGTSAFALGTTSTATLNGATSANGKNINVWDGSAYMSGKNNNGTLGTDIAVTLKRSVSLLPDPTEWNKILSPGKGFTRTKVSLPEDSAYYAQATARSNSKGYAKLESD
ncbi:hypothetical protein [Peribacillus muralis]|uniref:hypothetical protein n=1 Tax=Peribacillus muralis TaxID=264697 RepID=UPI003D07B6D8